jgi:class 3 adenylate cyclase
MRRNVPLRWIAEAEARSVREAARVRRVELELLHGEPSREPGSAWLKRFGRLVRGAARRVVKGYSRPGPTQEEIVGPMDADRVVVTLLVTDIVDSTRRVAEIGDWRWREILDRHNKATRCEIRRFGGREVSNRGDGFLATFDSPARAVRCAAAIGDGIAALGLRVRSGIHLGEIHRKRDEISGIAVHIAARIAAAALPGEALVSKAVHDFVAGSGLVFEDRGTRRLQGLPEEVRLYAIRDAGGLNYPGLIGLRPWPVG